MVKGIEMFRDYFRNYQDQYVLIGGVACDLLFGNMNMTFRATKDFDIVLVIESIKPDFGYRFWEFITEVNCEKNIFINYYIYLCFIFVWMFR